MEILNYRNKIDLKRQDRMISEHSIVPPDKDSEADSCVRYVRLSYVLVQLMIPLKG